MPGDKGHDGGAGGHPGKEGCQFLAVSKAVPQPFDPIFQHPTHFLNLLIAGSQAFLKAGAKVLFCFLRRGQALLLQFQRHCFQLREHRFFSAELPIGEQGEFLFGLHRFPPLGQVLRKVLLLGEIGFQRFVEQNRFFLHTAVFPAHIPQAVEHHFCHCKALHEIPGSCQGAFFPIRFLGDFPGQNFRDAVVTSVLSIETVIGKKFPGCFRQA